MHRAVLPSIFGSLSLKVTSISFGVFFASVLYMPLMFLPPTSAVNSPLAKRSSIFLPSFSAIQVPSSLSLPSPPPRAKLAAINSTPKNPSQRKRRMVHPPGRNERALGRHHSRFPARAKRAQFSDSL